MAAIRKIIALFIIILFGFPILFGIIWAVGLTQAAISPEFISELPQEIIAEVPKLTDELFRDAQDEAYIRNDNTRAWFKAAAATGISPQELMAETGLLAWMEDELSAGLEELGDVLRGRRRPGDITIDLLPLQDALRHEAIDRYIAAVLEKLPPCDYRELETWKEGIDRDINWWELPACRPELPLATRILRKERMEAIDDMDDVIILMEDAEGPRFPFSQTITAFSYGLFILPGIILLIAALIAATSPGGFFRWFGMSILISSVFPLLLAVFIRNTSAWALKFYPYAIWKSGATDLEELFLDKFLWIPHEIIHHLFTPVVTIAGSLCILGLVIFAVSFLVSGGQRSQPQPQAAATAAASSQPAPRTEPVARITEENHAPASLESETSSSPALKKEIPPEAREIPESEE